MRMQSLPGPFSWMGPGSRLGDSGTVGAYAGVSYPYVGQSITPG